MMSLRVCVDPPLARFDAIATAKQLPRSARLLGLKDIVASEYAAYQSACPDLESMPLLPLSEQARGDLLHCYQVETQPLEQLKALIRARQAPEQSAVCQYCVLNAPRTFDHYLPESLYPQFSVYAQNLVPCCWDCNQQRSTAWRNSQGERRHVHLYSDVIDQGVQVLFAEISVAKTPLATFRLELGAAHAHPFYQLLHRHFTQLGLLKRYQDASSAKLNEHHRTIHVQGRHFGRKGCIHVLREQLAEDRRVLGPHNWKVALLQAMLDTPEFIQLALDTPPSSETEKDGT